MQYTRVHKQYTKRTGKVCNALTGTSSAQICYICKATPKDMNNIEKLSVKDVNPETLGFGLSTLHAWIRFLECILHIAYRLHIKKWQVRGKEHQEKMKARKTKIQQEMKEKLGLLVDKPKPGGSGSSNDGNTARRFFSHPSLVSEITGVDVELIHRFSVILNTLASGYSIKILEFHEYALETARHFVNRYPWFYMPASVHKILLHGSSVVSAALLPIGQLSEEAQEARNKDLRRFREGFTRKMTRKSTVEDLVSALLVTSDPVVSGLRKLPKKPLRSLSDDVLNLIEVPQS